VALDLNEESTITWSLNIKDPGVYNIELEYLGDNNDNWVGWTMALDGKDVLIDEHNATKAYAWYPLGWIKIDSPGAHEFTLRPSSGDIAIAKVAAMRVTPVGL